MDGRAGQVAPIGGTDAGSDSPGVPFKGDRSTGAGQAPAAGTLSGSPTARASSSPEVIRAILSGIPRPSAGLAPTLGVTATPGPDTGTVMGSSGSTQLVEGAVHVRSIDAALPDVVARAEHTRVPFTMLLVRPGPAASAGALPPPATAADVEDLAAALSVSLSPVQDLYDAGRGHLAVIVPGRSGAGQREAMRLTRRAAAQGAPLFTWAAARYPRDADTAAGLLEVAANRLDGRLVSHTDAIATRRPERRAGRSGAAIWAGVGAAVLLGAVAFALHGSASHNPRSAAGALSSGPPGTAASNGQSASGSGSFSSTNGGRGSGTSGGAGASGGPGNPGGTGSSASGVGGAPGPGTGGSGTTTTTSPTSPPTTSTTTTSPTSTTTTTGPCNGLVNSLTCTVNNLLGGHTP